MTIPFYVSTAIPYVNAEPHLGFAYEAVLADVVARHARARGHDVRFVTGSDEHSLKNVLAAERAGVSVAELVRTNAARFAALRDTLDLSTDVFVRTSEPRHRAAVERLWRALAERGELYRAPYRGLYCAGCERFVDEGEERCDEHPHAALERIEEDNWFLRLSAHGETIARAIDEGRLRIEPEAHRREVLALLRAGLRDVSVSRSVRRARGWAIPVPGDDTQVIWVWLDALASYASAIGYGDDDDAFRTSWRDARERVHVLGKGILRFHAALWPALLSAAREPWPTRLFVHGYVTVEGAKIAKSGAAAISPFELVARHGTDAVRWFLLRHLPVDRDGDFSLDRFVAVHDAELANQLGNLVARTVTLIERAGGHVPSAHAAHEGELEHALRAEVDALATGVDEALDRFAPHDAASAISRVVLAANTYADRRAPWSLARDPAARAALETTLFHLADALRVVAIVLAPLLPTTARAIAHQLGADDLDALDAPGLRVRRGAPIFPRIAR
ncbi:methionine--tRNA ligase [Sandaracinus amylolyticus]|uniref:methionine--tRNA ligase n=1 Tax=Sandaracinus amylolyticus TaxID=927083 RepID=UPI001F005CA7|nr:methionine--tRNA ligase [Sandaracinus amylolyticus]UJR78311.1 Methionyl-tRNA synthetase [Sandaracinus amylolyticus]